MSTFLWASLTFTSCRAKNIKLLLVWIYRNEFHACAGQDLANPRGSALYLTKHKSIMVGWASRQGYVTYQQWDVLLSAAAIVTYCLRRLSASPYPCRTCITMFI
ncbi:hypothetical protein F4802DRAFT_545442 [Xylaria palmicola]|nr:hypothetical protein F4802DRAFT_545442 [Xylaria palmicola]